MKIELATLQDIPYIIDLERKEHNAIGFIPKSAYRAAIVGEKSGKYKGVKCNAKLWICTENNDSVGFLLMSFGRIARVNQIIIQPDARLFQRGKALLTTAVDYGNMKGFFDFGCACADDLESNVFWKKMG